MGFGGIKTSKKEIPYDRCEPHPFNDKTQRGYGLNKAIEKPLQELKASRLGDSFFYWNTDIFPHAVLDLDKVLEEYNFTSELPDLGDLQLDREQGRESPFGSAQSLCDFDDTLLDFSDTLIGEPQPQAQHYNNQPGVLSLYRQGQERLESVTNVVIPGQGYDAFNPIFTPPLQPTPLNLFAQSHRFGRKIRPKYEGIKEYIEVRGINIPSEVWAKAIMQVRRGLTKTANVLFDHLFNDEEIRRATLSGRSQTEALEKSKLKAIIVAVAWMMNNMQTRGLNPYDFHDDPHNTLSADQLQKIHKVFIDRRNERNRKLNRQSGRLPEDVQQVINDLGESSNDEAQPGPSNAKSRRLSSPSL